VDGQVGETTVKKRRMARSQSDAVRMARASHGHQGAAGGSGPPGPRLQRSNHLQEPHFPWNENHNPKVQSRYECGPLLSSCCTHPFTIYRITLQLPRLESMLRVTYTNIWLASKQAIEVRDSAKGSSRTPLPDRGVGAWVSDFKLHLASPRFRP
jgi:hypothetical protein